MKKALLIMTLIVLAACGAQKSTQEKLDMNLAIRDFIAVRGLEELDKIRRSDRDGWKTLTDDFIIYRARRDRYLVEFARRCPELSDNTEITPDIRSDTSSLRSRFDTLRGCRIHQIYALTEGEVIELEELGEVPGSRN